MDAPLNVDLNLPADRIGARPRRPSKRVWVGGAAIGDGAPIAVQSMCTTLTHDVDATIGQIEQLQAAGCEIARVAVPDKRGGEALKEIVRRSILPVVADIHFDYRLALMALDAKVHKLRLNPGNIHNKDGVREVVRRAKEQGTPIRIGVNHGSIGDRQPGDIRDEAQRMVDLALSEIKILEDLDFDDIVVSVKAFDVPTMVAAYRRLAKAVAYPLHLGVTEAGTLLAGSIRSTAGMSVLLYEGIGDTIRVSLSEDPVTEVKAGFDILKSLNLRDQGLTLVACPSCGRADIDLIPLAKVAEERLRALPHPMKGRSTRSWSRTARSRMRRRRRSFRTKDSSRRDEASQRGSGPSRPPGPRSPTCDRWHATPDAARSSEDASVGRRAVLSPRSRRAPRPRARRAPRFACARPQRADRRARPI